MSVDRRIDGVEDRLSDLAESVANVQASIEELAEGTLAQSERLWSAFGTLGALDGVAGGLSDIAELLGPLCQFAPPTTALPLAKGVAQALGTIRAALGGDDRDLNYTSLVTRWDGPVGFIGQPVTQPCHESAGQEPGR